MEFKITRGYTALVDDEDSDLARLKWYANLNGMNVYVRRSVIGNDGVKVHVVIHRIILERMLGRRLQTGELCDHQNGNTLDNRRSNLRLATRSENNRNARTQRNNKSGAKGVSQVKGGAYLASIQVNGKRVTLGHFCDLESAREAYREAAEKLHGEFARPE